jgi:hypothetical protein
MLWRLRGSRFQIRSGCGGHPDAQVAPSNGIDSVLRLSSTCANARYVYDCDFTCNWRATLLTLGEHY